MTIQTSDQNIDNTAITDRLRKVSLRYKRSEQKFLNENICPHQEWNHRPLAFQRGASEYLATLIVNDML